LLGGQHPPQGVPQPLIRLLADLRDQPRQDRDARQQHIAFPQPAHRIGEDGLRAIAGRPGPRVYPLPQVFLYRFELAQPVGGLDLIGVLEPRRATFGVALDAARVGDLELPGQVPGHATRYGQRIRQEHTEVAHRRQQQREPEPVVRTTPFRDQLPVRVVQEKQLLQVRLRRRSPVRAVGGDLLITQELHRHKPAPYEPGTAKFRERAHLLPVRQPRAATCFGTASHGKEDQLSRLP